MIPYNNLVYHTLLPINEFATDTPAEVAALEKWCEENNHPMSLSQVWAKGGEGAIDLANKVVALCDQENNYAPLYDLDKSIEEKVETIAKKVYGADGVDFTEEAQAQIAKFNELGWVNYQFVWLKHKCHYQMMVK